MSATTISSLFQLTPRYIRSINLERDFCDDRALEGYVLTPHAQECLGRLANGLHSTSTQRAWRLTGNYGSGKSSFALFLAHWFNGRAEVLSRTLDADVRYASFSIRTRPKYLPLLVTGSREPMGKAILRSLGLLLNAQRRRGPRPTVQLRIEALLAQERINDNEVVDLVQAANERLIKNRRGSGLLLLLDELGKFLEYAAYHSQSQDVYLLQKLAEAAAASGRSAPLFIIGMLHQGFDAYSENLDPSAQREWEKVAGRFEEILFNQPLLETSELIAAALKVRTSGLPVFAREEARGGLESAVRLGLFGGRGLSRKDISSLGERIYPLHGTTVPALVRAFSRFGQNERSLFSFLLSDEPFSLANFSERTIAPGSSYRLSDFYDYVRANFGYRLSAQSYRSHWTQIESVVERFATSDPVELSVAKTVGVLNLLDHPDLTPTEATIAACLSGPGGFKYDDVISAISRLNKAHRVLFRRGTSGSYCLWPHTSVDLETAYERASEAIGVVKSVSRFFGEFLESRPLVARRHYIETGNFRYFHVQYVPSDIAPIAFEEACDADGKIVVVLCETTADCERAEKLACSDALRLRRDLLVGVPLEPLSNQTGLVAEVMRWDWVILNTPELHADRFAREEVSRQRQIARQRLANRVHDLIGLHSLSGARALRWFSEGTPAKIASGRQLLERLSSLCDALYPHAPHVKNELLNRRSLSSAAAAARMRLTERIFANSNQAYLGMDPAKKPPEMSMYLSLLDRGRLHVKTDKGWGMAVPSIGQDPLHLEPCLTGVRNYVESRPDQRIKVSDLLALLSRSPYGVRDGLSLALLSVYAATNVQELSFYEDGTFLRELKADEFLRLTKAPEKFEIQLCRITGIRQEVFNSLLKILELEPSGGAEPLILDVVKPLCIFVAGLPDYVRNTNRLSPGALRVRAAVLAAREPATLLFKELPAACGMEGFPVYGAASIERARIFAEYLKRHLEELRTSFDILLDRLRESIRDEFDTAGPFEQVRRSLADRAQSVTVLANESRVKAFCLRLSDTTLADIPWLESLGSLLVLQPPMRWSDTEEDTFRRELHATTRRFKSLESIAFQNRRFDDFADAFRFSLTRSDGSEAQKVVFVDKQHLSDIETLAEEIEKLIRRNRVVGMAALSRVAWSALNEG